MSPIARIQVPSRLWWLPVAVTVGLLAACGSSSTAPRSTARASLGVPTIAPATPAPIPPPPAFPSATPLSTPSATSASGIRGITETGPTCPVQRVGGPSCTSPIVAEVMVTNQAGRLIATAISNPDGSFAVLLPPGTYTVSATRPSAGRVGGAARPAQVTVVGGRFSPVTLEFDTGIR